MNADLLMTGGAKLLFGAFVGVIGVVLGAWLVARILGIKDPAEELRGGNHAVALVMAASVLAIGLMVKNAIGATFNAVDLIGRSSGVAESMGTGHIFMYAGVHLLASITVSVLIVLLGVWVFTRMTRGVDEIKEAKEGNLAPAIVLATVMVVLAILVSPGLRTLLDGLLPLPTLGRDILLQTS